MRKDDCGETGNLTGRSMPLRLIFDTTPSFLGYFLCRKWKDHDQFYHGWTLFQCQGPQSRKIDRTCRNESLIFLAMTPTSTSFLAINLTSDQNIFPERLVEHNQASPLVVF